MWFVLNANTLNMCTRREQQIDEWNLQTLGLHHCSIYNTKGNTLQKMPILHGGERRNFLSDLVHEDISVDQLQIMTRGVTDLKARHPSYVFVSLEVVLRA